jgi:hypothetical protein
VALTISLLSSLVYICNGIARCKLTHNEQEDARSADWGGATAGAFWSQGATAAAGG